MEFIIREHQPFTSVGNPVEIHILNSMTGWMSEKFRLKILRYIANGLNGKTEIDGVTVLYHNYNFYNINKQLIGSYCNLNPVLLETISVSNVSNDRIYILSKDYFNQKFAIKLSKQSGKEVLLVSHTLFTNWCNSPVNLRVSQSMANRIIEEYLMSSFGIQRIDNPDVTNIVTDTADVGLTNNGEGLLAQVLNGTTTVPYNPAGTDLNAILTIATELGIADTNHVREAINDAANGRDELQTETETTTHIDQILEDVTEEDRNDHPF
jgi:hypothetical protein